MYIYIYIYNRCGCVYKEASKRVGGRPGGQPGQAITQASRRACIRIQAGLQATQPAGRRPGAQSAGQLPGRRPIRPDSQNHSGLAHVHSLSGIGKIDPPLRKHALGLSMNFEGEEIRRSEGQAEITTAFSSKICPTVPRPSRS